MPTSLWHVPNLKTLIPMASSYYRDRKPQLQEIQLLAQDHGFVSQDLSSGSRGKKAPDQGTKSPGFRSVYADDCEHGEATSSGSPSGPSFLYFTGFPCICSCFPLPLLSEGVWVSPSCFWNGSCQDCVSPCFYLSDPDKNIDKWKFTAVLLGQTKTSGIWDEVVIKENLPPDVTNWWRLSFRGKRVSSRGKLTQS